MALQVELVSPEQILFQGEADMVVCRTTDGEIAFLPGHVPFVGALGVAKVRILLADKSEEVAAVHGGFVEVKDDRVVILSDVAERPEEIDRAAAEAERLRIEELLRSGGDSDPELEKQLASANLRIDVFDYFTHQ